MPGWGTNQFQFIPPPAPGFQPQPTWGGSDYYRAHAGNADPAWYNHAWRHLRENRGYLGVGMHEARRYHRQAYGSTRMSSMLPEEIGHAAAYEAYRTWMHNSYMYEPLGGDRERQREGLIGLAAAEVVRLMQTIGRDLDLYACTSAVNASASTASHLFDEFGDEDDYYHHSRRGSYGGYDDPYINDDPLLYHRRRSISHSRRRAHSFIGNSSMIMPGSHGMMDPTYGAGYPTYMPSSYPMGGYGHAQSYVAPVMVPTTYEPLRHRRSSVSLVPTITYPTAGPVPPIVVSTASSSRSKRHRRSRSSDPSMRLEYPGYSTSARF